MKKILAWFMTWLASLTCNVDYVHQTDVHEYDTTAFYKLETEWSIPDYRSLNQQANMAESSVACRETNWTSSGKSVDYGNTAHNYTGQWFEDNTTVSINDISSTSKEFVFTGDCLIIAPFDCTLVAPTASNSDGTTMELTCTVGTNSYSIYITNMECWWCDEARNRTKPLYHTYEADSHKFKQGNVLGRAKEGETKVVVNAMVNGQVVDNGITLQKFFLAR